MAEIFGLGCSHSPIILTPPEVWHKGRERIYSRIPGYEMPDQLLEELGQDNGLTQDRLDHQKVIESFNVMRERLHQWDPDVLMRGFMDSGPSAEGESINPLIRARSWTPASAGVTVGACGQTDTSIPWQYNRTN